MGKGWRIAKIAGIDVYIHWSFLILPLIVSMANWSKGIGQIAAGVLWIAAVFMCVVLHELGHALMARQFGVGTRDIVLLPIGGVARLDRIPEKPFQELAIAVAGPAVNVLIVAALIAILVVSGSIAGIAEVEIIGKSFLVNLLFVNIGLVLFNMLPAFPMDGGRVLRSVLAMFIPYVQATLCAAVVGQVLAVLLGIVGVLSGAYMLSVVAMFVFFVGRAEAQAVAMRERQREIQKTMMGQSLPPGSIVFLSPDEVRTRVGPDWIDVKGTNVTQQRDD